jgi:molybdopterin/thiamine biosynthesis adenylyltransferase
MTGRDFNRHIPLFGDVGQLKIRAARTIIVGAGGLGSHILQQLALLGVEHLDVIDSEELAETNRNRYVTARFDDPIPGTPKVDIAERLIKAIDPSIRVNKVMDSFISESGFRAIVSADYVFGCLDSEGARLVLNELCSAYKRPSDVIPGSAPEYGGRICVSTWETNGCLMCRGLIDTEEAQLDLAGPHARRDRNAIYGVNTNVLGRSGPSVVTINGVIASLATTEFMVAVTGLREPQSLITYRGHTGRLTNSIDAPEADCFYCEGVRGQGDSADVQRYFREGVGQYLR